jgi:hypothetical protein
MASVFAQSAETLKIRSVREQREKEWLTEYISFLSIPNIAADTQHLRENARFIMQMMSQRGIGNLQLLQPDEKAQRPLFMAK